MRRYIAFAWNHQIAECNSVARLLLQRLTSKLPEWERGLTTDGLQVYYSNAGAQSSRIYQLHDNSGVILGNIFKRRQDVDCDEHVITFGTRESEELQRSEGRCLVDHYWGRYVAILRVEGRDRTRVLRDPTGAVPCLLTHFRGVDVVCSNIEDLAALRLVNYVINWSHIATYLWFDNLITMDTGFECVRQIQAGECVVVGGYKRNVSNNATFYWRPDLIHDTRCLDDRREAMYELRNVIKRCVRTWASCYNSILHELSGGLDSAVVLACLTNASDDVKVVCQNYFTQNVQGDERLFAQKAANLMGVELVETPLRPSGRTIEDMLGATKAATPAHTNLVLESRTITEQLVATRDIGAIFSGRGGDHFFQQMRTPLIAAEYAWRHGLDPGLITVITDTARFTRRPIWTVVVAALTSGLLHRHRDPYDQLEPSPLLANAARDAIRPTHFRHPWIDSARRLPGSKLLQIFNIIDSQNFYRVPCSYADIVHPLISQPILELCLHIPSYILTYDGMDRALVRGAFTGLVPPEIARRTIKGATTSYVNRMLVSNLTFIRHYLLDGLLLREGLLDRDKMDTSLREGELIRNPQLLFPVLNAIRAESWLRMWAVEGQRAAA